MACAAGATQALEAQQDTADTPLQPTLSLNYPPSHLPPKPTPHGAPIHRPMHTKLTPTGSHRKNVCQTLTSRQVYWSEPAWRQKCWAALAYWDVWLFSPGSTLSTKCCTPEVQSLQSCRGAVQHTCLPSTALDPTPFHFRHRARATLAPPTHQAPALLRLPPGTPTLTCSSCTRSGRRCTTCRR